MFCFAGVGCLPPLFESIYQEISMSKVSVVIGANYGDEGKGLMTDFLSRIKNADLVVRFNGGAQAGHTVVTPEGKRHVFSHFGSGTLAGVPTFLSKFFILNPIIFKKEREKLISIGIAPRVIIDPRSMVTTPWDMIWNQFQEELRGEGKHGSCGVGIGATVDRYERYGDLALSSPDKVWLFYQELINAFTPTKAQEEIYDRYHGYIHDIGVYGAYMQDLVYMKDNISGEDVSPIFNYAIFEGAQGLGLDKHMGQFPYVTRSNTGLRNVRALQWELNFDFDEVVYVTRSYMTRHGAGPFEEFSDIPIGISDDTNVPNKWQDSIRFGPMGKPQWNSIQERIDLDLHSNGFTRNSFNMPVSVTHRDQYYNDFFTEAQYDSFGPTWKDVGIK